MGGPAWERRGDVRMDFRMADFPNGKMEPIETFWTRMSYRSTELPKTALFFLRIRPSEAACERSLSSHGLLCWERGARLLDESIRALMFVRSNRKLLRPSPNDPRGSGDLAPRATRPAAEEPIPPPGRAEFCCSSSEESDDSL